MGLLRDSRCLRLENGELPLELLPELQELTYLGSGDEGDAFTSLIDFGQKADRPGTLVSRSPRPRPSKPSSDDFAITSE
jgi:hypothetical protein